VSIFRGTTEKKILAAESDENSLGRLAVQLGFISNEQLATAISSQREQHSVKLGELFVERFKWISCDDLKYLLAKQRVLRMSASEIDHVTVDRFERSQPRERTLTDFSALTQQVARKLAST